MPFTVAKCANGFLWVSVVLRYLFLHALQEDLGKPHLTSWHSWVGLLAILLFCANAAHGIFKTVFSSKTASLQWIWVSSLHRSLGITAHLVGLAACTLGVYSGWGLANLGGQLGAAALTAMLLLGEAGILGSALKK